MVGMGVSNLVAVETDDAVLIMNKAQSQEIKNTPPNVVSKNFLHRDLAR